jgi:hypothetical protein
MNKKKRICKGMSRLKNRPCRNQAVEGSDYCKFHGGGGVGGRGGKGRPKGSPKPAGAGGKAMGNTNSLKHGAYSARLLAEEQPHYEMIKAAFEEELGGANRLSASDRLLIFRLATNGAKITSALESGAHSDAIVPLQRLELELLRELKSTRASKDSGSSMGTSPAEVIAALLVRARGTAAALPEPGVDQGEVIDAEFSAVDSGQPERD